MFSNPYMPQDYLDAAVNPSPAQVQQEQAAERLKYTGRVVVGLLVVGGIVWWLNKR